MYIYLFSVLFWTIKIFELIGDAHISINQA